MDLVEEKFEADTLSEYQVNALIAELRGDTPLSQLSHDESREVFDRMAERGYLIAKEV